MISCHIQRCDVVAGIKVGVFNQSNIGILCHQRGELFFQVAHHDVYLRNAVVVQPLNYRIDHPLAVYFDQRLRRCQRDRVHPVSQPCRHNNGSFYFRHFSVPHFPLISSVHPERFCSSLLRSDTAAGNTRQIPRPDSAYTHTSCSTTVHRQRCSSKS